MAPQPPTCCRPVADRRRPYHRQPPPGSRLGPDQPSGDRPRRPNYKLHTSSRVGGRSHSGEHGHGTKQGKWRPDFKNPGRALQPLVAFLQEGGEGQATQISPPLSDGQGAGKGMPKHMDVLHWVSVRASQLLPLQVAHTGAEATRSGDLSGIRELGLQKEKGEVFFPLWRQIFMEAWAWRSCWRSFVA